jgi:tRNA U34 5-carboxymethylaminomethyl modifying GTPase MnmE/TrmE
MLNAMNEVLMKYLDRAAEEHNDHMEIRHALHHLGEITGELTTDEIPSRMCDTFCIGK